MKPFEKKATKRWILLSLHCVLLSCAFGCAAPEKTTRPKDSAKAPDAAAVEMEKDVSAATPPVAFVPSVAPFYPTPTRMDLCGEPVPLNSQDVFERFDREFTIIVYNHSQVYLWLKRMERYFPWIEERLQRAGLHDDLKYVVIAESDLLPTAASPKGAAGPWQFMPNTGTSYGLEQRGSFDSRYDFERATESALRLLEDLRRRHGSWAMAIAAYNCGDKRILEEARAQRVSDFYHLKLPQETERYVFRILAIKAVLSNPSQYGYFLPKGQGYSQERLDRVSLSLASPVPIQTAAEAAGVTYREFKRLNPTLRADHIPAGTCEVKVPEGKGTFFEEKLPVTRGESPAAEHSQPLPPRENSPGEKTASVASARPSADKPSGPKGTSNRSHTVQKGDTLNKIARTYKVSVQDLRQANHIKGENVKAGQTLRIP
ncbi:MAG: LysM peptidoglycan-binding domain-containing protein [Deltaproteobacteria bacterium]|nr:LysM peptidoglycan-binding domain-containing protein [Deltaproteobacteria bacterium]